MMHQKEYVGASKIWSFSIIDKNERILNKCQQEWRIKNKQDVLVNNKKEGGSKG